MAGGYGHEDGEGTGWGRRVTRRLVSAPNAFSGEYDLRNRVTGALFVDPPNFNALHTEFRQNRDPGSREVEPVYRGGRTVRFSSDVGNGAPPLEVPWTGTRVLILQHPSDPGTWWSPSLLLSRPD